MSDEQDLSESQLVGKFLSEASKLSKKLIDEATATNADPAMLMRLTALGVSHCLIGITTLLEEKT